jgi:hypothetical protein
MTFGRIRLVAVIVASVRIAQGATHYVDLNSSVPATPFATWSSAATNIQDAVDVAAPGDLVLVTNGVYGSGSRIGTHLEGTCRIVVTNPIVLMSVNGPNETMILGSLSPSARCISLAGGAAISGFTLTNGYTGTTHGPCASIIGGGGAWCASNGEIVTNCIVVGNRAGCDGGGVVGGTVIASKVISNSASAGGGTYQSIVRNCVILGNNSPSFFGQGGGVYGGVLENSLIVSNSALQGTATGGGVYGAVLRNCTVIGNAAISSGGGVSGRTLSNCIVYYDSASTNADFDSSILDHCCAPGATNQGNISVAPGFVDLNLGDFRLQSNSPCINSGANNGSASGVDLFENVRISGMTVDIGAFEYPNPNSRLSYAWALEYGLSTDGSADFTDSDGDGMNNWQEWLGGTNPKVASSFLQMLPLTNGPSGMQVSWTSVSDRMYVVERATNGSSLPAFSLVQSNLPGSNGVTSYTDPDATGLGPYLYRVRTTR